MNLTLPLNIATWTLHYCLSSLQNGYYTYISKYMYICYIYTASFHCRKNKPLWIVLCLSTLQNGHYTTVSHHCRMNITYIYIHIYICKYIYVYNIYTASHNCKKNITLWILHCLSTMQNGRYNTASHLCRIDIPFTVRCIIAE